MPAANKKQIAEIKDALEQLALSIPGPEEDKALHMELHEKIENLLKLAVTDEKKFIHQVGRFMEEVSTEIREHDKRVEAKDEHDNRYGFK